MRADRRTDRHDEANRRFSQFRERAQKPSTHLETSSDIRINENPSSGSWVVPCGLTDGQTDMTKLTGSSHSFVNLAQKPSTHLFSTLCIFVPRPFKEMIEASPAGSVTWPLSLVWFWPVTCIWQDSGMDLNSCIIYNVLAKTSVPQGRW